MYTKKDLDDVFNEIDRFVKKAQELNACTKSAESTKIYSPDHYDKFKADVGFYDIGPSKRRAAVKRAALDLRIELLKLT